MSFQEIKTVEIDRDRENNRRSSRTFRVWNANPMQLDEDPTEITNDNGDGSVSRLPPLGAPLGARGMVLDKWSARNIDQYGVFDAVAEYSNNRSGLLRPNLDYAWSGSFQTETTKIPVALLTYTNIPGIQDSRLPPGTYIPPIRLFDWVFSEQVVLETRVRHSRKVRIQTNLSLAINRILAQSNKLQHINGGWFRFEAADYRQITSTTIEFTYSLLSDTGTDIIAPATAAVHPHPISNVRWPAAEWIFAPISNIPQVRPPFCVALVRRGTPTVNGRPNPNEPPTPEFYNICPYTVSTGVSSRDGLGWQSLPGILAP